MRRSTLASATTTTTCGCPIRRSSPTPSRPVWRFRRRAARPARRSARPHYVKWNSFVPRLGMTYDLLGTGKTVLKCNYGMYRFNPGVGVAASANPNQATKSITYAWTDTKVCATCMPGDGLYQAGEETSSTPTAQRAVGHDQRRPEHRAAVLAPGDRLHRAAADRGRRRARRASSTTRSRTRPARSSPIVRRQRLHGAVQRGRSGPGRRHRHGRRPEPDRLRHSDTRRPRDFPTTNVVSNSQDNGSYKTVRVLAEQASEPQLLARRRRSATRGSTTSRTATRTRRTVRLTTTSRPTARR